jgi:hypothetical protein
MQPHYVAIIAPIVGGVAVLVATIFLSLLTESGKVTWKEPAQDVIRVTVGAVTAILVSAYAADIIAASPQVAVDTISNPWFTPLWLVIGVALFWMRGYLPKSYGMVEISVGLTAIFYAIIAPIDRLPPKLLAMAAGIYVIVRGLDNFEKGLSAQTKKRWAKVFWKFSPT